MRLNLAQQSKIKALSVLTAILAGFTCAVLPHGYAEAYLTGENPIDAANLAYLSPAAIDVAVALPPPPATGEADDLKELKVISNLQYSRASTDCERANYEVPVSLERFYGPKYGPLSQSEVNKLTKLFAVVVTETKFFSNEGKSIWQRERPYEEDPSIKPCVELDRSFSYPSGHAAVARSMARILTVLYPERWKEFSARADQIAFDRVIGGVHHPLDVSAGESLGDAVANALLRNAKFLNDLKAAAAGDGT